MARPFLEAAVESSEAVVERTRQVIRELRVAMFCSGAGTIAGLQKVELQSRSRGES